MSTTSNFESIEIKTVSAYNSGTKEATKLYLTPSDTPKLYKVNVIAQYYASGSSAINSEILMTTVITDKKLQEMSTDYFDWTSIISWRGTTLVTLWDFREVCRVLFPNLYNQADDVRRECTGYYNGTISNPFVAYAFGRLTTYSTNIGITGFKGINVTPTTVQWVERTASNISSSTSSSRVCCLITARRI